MKFGKRQFEEHDGPYDVFQWMRDAIGTLLKKCAVFHAGAIPRTFALDETGRPEIPIYWQRTQAT
jgi:hypothetical protein